MTTKNSNRIKVMQAERNHTNKWLAEQVEVGKNPATVSKWATNILNRYLKWYFKITEVLKCNYTDLTRDIEAQKHTSDFLGWNPI